MEAEDGKPARKKRRRPRLLPERAMDLRRMDEIEDAINAMKTPLSFADQLYVLREHVIMVRHRLESPRAPLAVASA